MQKTNRSGVKRAAWQKPLIIWGSVIVVCAIAAGIAVGVTVRNSRSESIDSYDKCKNAGGRIGESYPEQCFIYGKSYVNTGSVRDSTGYVGLSEQAAKDKAKSAGVPSRVVERDGEPLPVTMDYVPGRVNLYVRSGDVYRVDIEDEEQQV